MAILGFEDYERNEAQLAMNSQAYAPERFSPPARPSCALAGPHALWPVWRTHDGALSPASREPHCARLSLRATYALSKENQRVSVFQVLIWIAPLERFSWNV